MKTYLITISLMVGVLLGCGLTEDQPFASGTGAKAEENRLLGTILDPDRQLEIAIEPCRDEKRIGACDVEVEVYLLSSPPKEKEPCDVQQHPENWQWVPYDEQWQQRECDDDVQTTVSNLLAVVSLERQVGQADVDLDLAAAGSQKPPTCFEECGSKQSFTELVLMRNLRKESGKVMMKLEGLARGRYWLTVNNLTDDPIAVDTVWKSEDSPGEQKRVPLSLGAVRAALPSTGSDRDWYESACASWLQSVISLTNKDYVKLVDGSLDCGTMRTVGEKETAAVSADDPRVLLDVFLPAGKKVVLKHGRSIQLPNASWHLDAGAYAQWRSQCLAHLEQMQRQYGANFLAGECASDPFQHKGQTQQTSGYAYGVRAYIMENNQ